MRSNFVFFVLQRTMKHSDCVLVIKEMAFNMMVVLPPAHRQCTSCARSCTPVAIVILRIAGRGTRAVLFLLAGFAVVDGLIIVLVLQGQNHSSHRAQYQRGNLTPITTHCGVDQSREFFNPVRF